MRFQEAGCYSTSMFKPSAKQTGFTIVELLIVIVVIGILAAITIVAYRGISQRATAASLTADLSNSSKRLKLYQVDNSGYPLTNDCSALPAASSICLKGSSGTTYTYQPDNAANPKTFSLIATSGNTNYRITSESAPLQVALVCPLNFIVVPGSSTYGTSDFCTMKYNAKVASATVPVSQASGTPWVSISQTTAATYSPNVVGCTGCHLITETEYLTIAQNVLGVPSNWSSGVVGSGFIYSGHDDSVPANSLAADSNDANGYSGTGQSSPSNQRRTLTLTNGEVIWDIAGNVWNWTAGTSTTGQPGITAEPGYAWKEWTAVTAAGSLPYNPSPTTTGLANANTWNSSKGVGLLYSNAGETAVRGFLRGGAWDDDGGAGVLALYLGATPGIADAYIGFRVSR